MNGRVRPDGPGARIKFTRDWEVPVDARSDRGAPQSARARLRRGLLAAPLSLGQARRARVRDRSGLDRRVTWSLRAVVRRSLLGRPRR